MDTPKPPTPNPRSAPQAPAGVSATIIAEVGSGVTRLATVAVPLAVAAAHTLEDNLPRLLTHVRASLEDAAAPAQRGELAAAASDLVSTGATLTLGLLRVAVRGLEAVGRAVGAETTDASEPPRA